MKKLFATALAAIFLVTGCTKEIVYVPTDGPETPEVETTTRIKLGVGLFDDTKTKAAEDHYTGSATVTNGEDLIYNYALFIFKSSGLLEASLVETIASDPTYVPKTYAQLGNKLEFSQAQNPGVIDDDGYITISSGNKTFFAVVNAPKELLARQLEFLNNNSLTRELASEQELTFTDLSAIIGSYDNGIVEYDNPVTDGNSNNRGFMMTTLGNNGFQTQYLDETNENDPPVEVKLIVARAMAKVSVASNLDHTVDLSVTEDPNQLYGTLHALKYKIRNNPNKMYIVPNITNGILTTPYYYTTGVTTSNYFDSHNTSHPDGYIPVSKNDIANGGNDERTYAYCIENGNLTPRQGNATMAVIEGVFTPGGQAAIYEKLSDATQTTTPFAYKETFYRVWIPGHTSGGAIVGNEYANNGYFRELPTQQEIDDFVTVNYPDFPLGNAGHEQPTIDEYEDGVCFYRLPLKDETSIAPYTVKRNNYYKIDITKVSGPGYTDEDGGGKVDPTDPLEPQTEIDVYITIENWNEVNQSGAL